MKMLGILLISLMMVFSTANAGLIKSYDFNGSYSDTLGNGVDLVASGGSIAGGLYNFTENQGLRLTSALTDTSNYAIEMRLRIDDNLANWNKLIDFMDLTSDNGMYLLNGQFDFYVSGSHPLGGPVSLNEFFTLAFVRNANVITTYFNDVALTPFNDLSNQAVAPLNVLNFFEDDTVTNQGEAFAGSVDFIRFHADENSFGNEPIPTVPEPSTFAIFALGLIGLMSRRFRK